MDSHESYDKSQNADDTKKYGNQNDKRSLKTRDELNEKKPISQFSENQKRKH